MFFTHRETLPAPAWTSDSNTEPFRSQVSQEHLFLTRSRAAEDLGPGSQMLISCTSSSASFRNQNITLIFVSSSPAEEAFTTARGQLRLLQEKWSERAGMQWDQWQPEETHRRWLHYKVSRSLFTLQGFASSTTNTIPTKENANPVPSTMLLRA